MKKLGLFLICFVLFMPLVSAEFLGLDDFYLEDMIENDWLRFGLIFLLIFAFIFYSLKKFFRNDRKIAGFISIIISLMMASFIFRTDFLLDFVGEEMFELISTIAILVFLTFFILTMLKKFGCKGIAISLILSWFVIKMFNPDDYYFGEKFSLLYEVFTHEVTLGAFFIILLLCFVGHHKPKIPPEFSGRLREGNHFNPPPLRPDHPEPDERIPEQDPSRILPPGSQERNKWNKDYIRSALGSISANTGISMSVIIKIYREILKRDPIGRKSGNERKIIIQVNITVQKMREDGQDEGDNPKKSKRELPPSLPPVKRKSDEGENSEKPKRNPASYELHVGGRRVPRGENINSTDLTNQEAAKFTIRNGGKGGILAWRAACTEGLELSKKVGKLKAKQGIDVSVRVLDRKRGNEHVTIFAKRGEEKEGVKSLISKRIAKSKIYYNV